MRDALALAVSVVWFAANFILWVIVEEAIELFGCSFAMGATHFTGFLSYLRYRDRQRP